ncbi:LysM peptidoglycan-binding domain-containing protein [Chlamydia pecorum]|uniref:LysM domain protein n=2 Tax=Chlamydia pecorum TaxID=85991 RepID=A0AA40PQU5_9CHLA|nr:LysM peptidoglycan-binding domain-containing protein [Chlamydia pecorum]AGW38294.1 muramidase [Chlamydia pecorum PV3056/3]AGW39219.1 muramidase [Chlamydia pecorum W73]AGW40144.1 muramidase [Chlamydia pecorum P787]ETF38513.1 muramidase [Chlamydia pecorum VR629]ETF39018.1 muramidase [Chlamydia pecorum DBDeUG]
MNRRDMVITAVLMNAILLVALFATSKRGVVKNYAENYSEFSSEKIVKVLAPEEKLPEASQVAAVVPAQPVPVAKEVLAAQFMEEQHIVVSPQQPAQEAQEVQQQPQPVVEERKEAFTTVIVKKGDFLERIAKANHTTVSTLMQLNDLSSTQLKIGQVLKVPVVEQVATQSSRPETLNPENYYTVQEGDSPWTIALRNHIRLEELLRLNNLDEHKARRIRPGDQLRIR